MTTPLASETAPVRELLTVLDDHTRFLTGSRTRLRRQYAAAGLARCRALLKGMCILREQGRADTIGVLGRALVEAWLVSLYVLLKGKDDSDDSVLIELGKEHARSMKTFVDRVAASDALKAAVSDWDETTRDRKTPDGQPIMERPKFEAIARALPDLLAKTDPNSPFPVLPIYDQVYRAESAYSAHPGVGSLGRYVAYDPGEERDAIIDNPGPPFPRQERLAAMLTTFLAVRVFKAFGIVTDPRISAAYDRLSAEAQVDTPSETK